MIKEGWALIREHPRSKCKILFAKDWNLHNPFPDDLPVYDYEKKWCSLSIHKQCRFYDLFETKKQALEKAVEFYKTEHETFKQLLDKIEENLKFFQDELDNEV